MTYHEMKNGHILLVGGIFPAYKKSRTYTVRRRQEDGIPEDYLGRVQISEAGRGRYKVNYGSSCYQFNFSARLYKRKPHLLHILDMNGYYTHKDDMCIENGSMFKCILEAIEEAHLTFPPKRSEEELAPKTLWQKIRNYLRSKAIHRTYVEWEEGRESMKWWKENNYGWVK
tara:strand:- start:154 stop:666 length:513 start_codon:yes stop_codon:yes gene_type:complete